MLIMIVLNILNMNLQKHVLMTHHGTYYFGGSLDIVELLETQVLTTPMNSNTREQ